MRWPSYPIWFMCGFLKIKKILLSALMYVGLRATKRARFLYLFKKENGNGKFIID